MEPRSGPKSSREHRAYGMRSVPKKDNERSRRRDLSKNPWSAEGRQNPANQKATGIENLFRYALLRKGINFIEQASIGPWSIDFLLPDYMACVEADGEYWHSSTKAIMKDRKKDAWLRNKGYTVFHFDGKEIIQNADYCVEKLMKSVNKNVENIALKIQESISTISETIEDSTIDQSYEEQVEDEDITKTHNEEISVESDYEKWIKGGIDFSLRRTSI